MEIWEPKADIHYKVYPIKYEYDLDLTCYILVI